MAIRPLVAGNWKMHGLQAARTEARAVAAGLAAMTDPPEVVVCPPYTLLADVVRDVAGSAVDVGAQDCHWLESGAHTGAVSAGMLADAGARYVIVGHSERRRPEGVSGGDTDAVVRAKAEAALAAGLAPIVCVGETREERDAGDAETVTQRQVAASWPDVFAAEPDLAARACVAYEPVWAIGAGVAPQEEDIAAMHAVIQTTVGAATRVLYGGSVKPGNARAILATDGVGGVLVGGASLAASDFLEIAQSALLHP